MANRLGRQMPKLRLPQRLVCAGYQSSMGQLFLEQVDTTFIQEVCRNKGVLILKRNRFGIFVERFFDCLGFLGV